MLHAGGVGVAAGDLLGVVDTDGLSPRGAREVYVAEGAAHVREAVRFVGQVPVHPDNQTSAVDAGGDA
jgi:hypothetical protein